MDGGDQSHNTLKRSITIAKASKRRMPVKIIFLGINPLLQHIHPTANIVIIYIYQLLKCAAKITNSL